MYNPLLVLLALFSAPIDDLDQRANQDKVSLFLLISSWYALFDRSFDSCLASNVLSTDGSS